MDSENKKTPCIFEYDDYRRFLKDYYHCQKAKRKTFSHRYFSRIAGFRSPNMLKRVIEGQRNLSAESINKFIKALNFNCEEASFYKNLVGFNQARTSEDKQHFAREIVHSRVYKKLKPLARVQFEYWSNWYNIVIREMVVLEGFKEDPSWIAKTLNPPITSEEAKRSLQQLQDLKLIVRNSFGKLVQSQGYVSSGDEVVSASVAQFHREMIGKARESLDRFSEKERQVSTVTFSLNHQEIESVKQMITGFRKQLIEKLGKKHDGDQVFQFNLQIFPLTQAIEKEVS